jgi:exonuclease VII large subunit
MNYTYDSQCAQTYFYSPRLFDVTIKSQESALEKRIRELEEKLKQKDDELKKEKELIKQKDEELKEKLKQKDEESKQEKEELIKQYEDNYRPAYPDYGLVSQEDYLKLAVLAISHLQIKYDRVNKPFCLFDSFSKKYDKNHIVNLHEAGLFITAAGDDGPVYILNMASPRSPHRYVEDVVFGTNESCQYWFNSTILQSSLQAQKEGMEQKLNDMNPIARKIYNLFYKEPDESEIDYTVSNA